MQNARQSPFPKQNTLGGLTLLPWYSLTQVKCAVLRHCYQTAHVLIRASVEVSLETCIAMRYVHIDNGNRDLADRAYSFAFVCHKTFAPQWSLRDGENVFAKESNGELWVTLAETNIYTILRELAQGRGKLVVRVFWYWPRLVQNPEELRKAMLDEEEIRRGCEATTAAGSPISGPGSPCTMPGSPGSAGSAGTGDGSRADFSLGEPAACAHCGRMKQV